MTSFAKFVVLVLFSVIPAAPLHAANWTFLIYMNGNNNLEKEVDFNFNQMSRVDSTKNVNIVIQAARQSKKRVLRGRVQQDAQLTVSDGFEDLDNVDMGKAETLSKFLQWGIKTYPATNYAVIIWNHGQGWRAAEPGTSTPGRISTPNPYRAISYDDLHGSKLYNKDVQNVLEAAVARSIQEGGLGGRKFDIVGFDACLMAMIETTYALRKSASLMLGSEELVPGHGMPYEAILREISAKPSLPPTDVARVFVEEFGRYYSDRDPTTTMAAIDVEKGAAVAQSLDALSVELIASIPDQRNAILAARQQCPVYAPDSERDGNNYFFHVDLGCILDSLKSRVGRPAVQAASQKVLEQLAQSVLFNKVGAARASFGSNGLAIYFPQTLDQYRNDSFAEGGYEKNNKIGPVDFVRDIKWADFINTLLRSPPRPK